MSLLVFVLHVYLFVCDHVSESWKTLLELMLFPFAGYDKAAKAVYLRDIWPRRDEIAVGCSAMNSSYIHFGFLNDWSMQIINVQ